MIAVLLWIAVGVWALVALVIALLVGASIRLADLRDRALALQPQPAVVRDGRQLHRPEDDAIGGRWLR